MQMRDSLDFDFQKDKALNELGPNLKLRYGTSFKMERIKEEFKGSNIIPKEEDIKLEKELTNVSKKDVNGSKWLAVKEKLVKKLPMFIDFKDMEDIVEKDPNMKDKVAETSFDSLVYFNKDMKTLALNAYQMKDLIGYVQEENDILLEWMSWMETDCFLNEEMICKVHQQVMELNNGPVEHKDEDDITYLKQEHIHDVL